MTEHDDFTIAQITGTLPLHPIATIPSTTLSHYRAIPYAEWIARNPELREQDAPCSACEGLTVICQQTAIGEHESICLRCEGHGNENYVLYLQQCREGQELVRKLATIAELAN